MSWRRFLAASASETEIDDLRRHERTGRPLAAVPFVKRLEGLLGRPLKSKKPGRKPKDPEK
jgi:putative transposase